MGPSSTNVTVFSPSVVIDACHVPALRSDMACSRVVVCLSVHGVEPIIGRDDFNSKVCHGRRLTDHDVFLLAGFKTLRGDVGAASTRRGMSLHIYFLAIFPSSVARSP